MEYVQLTMEDYIKSKQEIKKDLGGIVKSFVRVGWHLTRINNSEAYKHDGYNTIAEFAKAEYGMNPSGVTRFMQVYEKYSVPGDTPELQDRYKDFNFSQLTEMLKLPEEDREMFRPEVKREAIREYKDFVKENENSLDSLMNWKKEPEDMVGKAILEFFRANKELLNKIYSSSGTTKELAEIINPSGNRYYRHKTVFLTMYNYETGISMKEFGKPNPVEMTWERFIEITKGIFDSAAAGGRTWENYFEEPEEQIPGQDSILNHPELMPEETQKEEPQIAPAQKQPQKQEKPAKKERKSREIQETLKTQPAKQAAEPEEPQNQKEGIAPAQKSAETPKEEGPDETKNGENTGTTGNGTEEQKGEAAAGEEAEETQPIPAVMNEPEVVEKPFTRKDYIDSLTAYGTADYLSKEIKDMEDLQVLRSCDFWEHWLKQNVDENGLGEKMAWLG